MSGTVTVLGLNGHIGRAVALAFADAGWQVFGFGRSNRHPDPRIGFVQGDAENVADMRRAIGDSDVVVNALNLPYDKWDKGRLEGQVARVVEAMGTGGRTLMFPGNIYNYAADEPVLTPQTPQQPQTSRGEIRVRSEKLIEAAAGRGHLRAIILRAGDYYGPDCSQDWLDQGILREAGKGRAAMIGKPGAGHAWAYLPDIATAFVKLAEARSEFRVYETFHFAGHFVTPERFLAAIQKTAPSPLKVVGFPWMLLGLIGIADPVIREVGKMRYLWEHPMQLRDGRLEKLLGKEFGTPLDEAVGATVRTRFFPEVRAAA